jgi:hypothetical protein
MSGLMGKRVRIGKYAIPALLLVALTVGTVAAAIYVILQFTVTVTVEEFPRVNFYNWGTGDRTNTFSESFNIFPNVTTIQENATHGIYSETAGTCYLRISSISNTTNLERVNVTVYNGGQLKSIVWNYGESLPQSWGTGFTTAATTYYTIWMEVTGASVAYPGKATDITVEMKVESP